VHLWLGGRVIERYGGPPAGRAARSAAASGQGNLLPLLRPGQSDPRCAPRHSGGPVAHGELFESIAADLVASASSGVMNRDNMLDCADENEPISNLIPSRKALRRKRGKFVNA
jgi:hypothetical protein